MSKKGTNMNGGIDKVFPANSELFRSCRHGSFSIWFLPVQFEVHAWDPLFY